MFTCRFTQEKTEGAALATLALALVVAGWLGWRAIRAKRSGA
jgi:hypothetical protein